MRAARRARILGEVDLGLGRCLEIGPLSNPVVGADVADVRYVDVVDRDGLLAHYAGNPAVDPDAIPQIHFSLTRPDGTVSSLAEAVGADAPYQHVVASHVIEHVPDLIGWLRDVASVVAADGALLLAIPDRRYCFDVRRTPTTAGQVVQAHLDGDRTPSARAVVDHFLRAVDYPADRAWSGEAPPEAASHPVEDVMQQLARQQDGAYVDCHVWPMSPRGFADLVGDLLRLGLVDFSVERITATRVGDQEFYATLRPLPSGDARERAVAEALVTLRALHDALPDEAPAAQAAGDDALRERLANVEDQLSRTRERLVKVRAARDRALRQRDDARAAGPAAETTGLRAGVARWTRRG
ncbi:hypothetical protein J2X46_002560 [Nocardioides sp. BE266]|uniref:class I SAM-dependent methyltransferase n=1 Tax=Nocardioides sp. BE266 TaxID=2817725 RepID=UPI002857552F|nr:methyltransferase domain-containing protein [Nocardioides sp. BE266]MDR7253570.1 hypothetical protein [Nocardioides sp. BE266]